MTRPLPAIALGLALVVPGRAWACAVCFGAEGDPQTESLNMAILTLLGTTYTLFGAMLTLGFFLWRRAQKLADAGLAGSAESNHG